MWCNIIIYNIHIIFKYITLQNLEVHFSEILCRLRWHWRATGGACLHLLSPRAPACPSEARTPLPPDWPDPDGGPEAMITQSFPNTNFYHEHVSASRGAEGSSLMPTFFSVDSGSALRHACFCYALICSLPVSAYLVLVTSLRYHLFIWSVFSPKLLYEGMHLLITAAVCAFFTAMDQTNMKSQPSSQDPGK